MVFNPYNLYYLEINIFCIIILSLVFVLYSKEKNNSSEAKAFNNVILVTIVYCISDIFAALLKNQTFTGVRALLYISNIVFIAFPLGLIYFWEKYVFYRLNYLGYKRNVLNYIFTGILIVFLLLDISTPYTGFSFILDENNLYSRKIGAYLIPFVCFAYLLYITFNVLILSLKNDYITAKEDTTSISMFTIPPLVAAAIQILIYGCTCSQVGFTISILMVFITSQMNMISKDKLTGLNNRSEFEKYLNDIKKSAHSLLISFTDIDNFKELNEKIGFYEGDLMLQSVAKAITESALQLKEHVFISRYDNDEFVIVLKDCSENAKKKLEDNINKKIEEYNQNLQKNIQLSVSTASIFDIISEPSDIKVIIHEAKDLMNKIRSAKKIK